MSINTCGVTSFDSSVDSDDLWTSLPEQLQKNNGRRSVSSVFGDSAKGGSVYRWGLSVANSSLCDPVTNAIAILATDGRIGKKQGTETDLLSAVGAFTEWLQTTDDLSAADCAAAIMWAAAIPALAENLEPDVVRSLLESLIQLRESVLQRHEASSISHLMIGAELGLTLAWRCKGVPGTDGLKSSSIVALTQWVEREQESISAALEQPLQTRLTLASLIRCRRLIQKTTKRGWTKQANHIGDRLATWVCAMTMHTGSSIFSNASRKQVKDDLGPSGLLAAACDFNAECLTGALTAALGQMPSGGRLAWQVSLPEAMHHDGDAKVAVMFPDWDVRRGRTHIDYSSDDVRVEIFAGRKMVITGTWQAMIETDGAQQSPDGSWSEICEYSDDDVHYLEIEQPWTDGMLLQRQFMLVRDDRCLMLADSIVPQGNNPRLPESINYSCRLPLPESIHLNPEPETREAFLSDHSDRALVIPMSASEWTIGPTDAKIRQSSDGCLVLSTSGRNRLYAPLWFDFQKRRFKRKRTWRQLTIADQLRLVSREEAAGFRVQVGSEQWVVYRSLGERACRSFLGKHLVAGFFGSRFDPEDGGHEALVTVDDDEHDE